MQPELQGFLTEISKKLVRKGVQGFSGLLPNNSTVSYYLLFPNRSIHFICGYSDVESIDEITKGMVNSQFRSWYKPKVCDSATESDLRVALKKFFHFLATEKGIVNQKVLDALK